MAHKRHGTWNSSSEIFRDDLEDICLDENAKPVSRPLPPGSRPALLGNAVHECFFVAVIAFAAASSVFLQRSMLVIAADIGTSLNMSPAEMAWINGASSLMTGAFLVPFGHMADICRVLTRKYLLLLSLTAFSIITVSTSFSGSGIVVDIMAGFAGLACAAIIPIAVGILSLVYPEPSRRKNIVFSSFLMGNPFATIIGGLGAGGVASTFNWKATFLFLGILYALIMLLSWLVVPNVSEPRSDIKFQKMQQFNLSSPFVLVSRNFSTFDPTPRKFDWTGLMFLVVGVLLFTVALTVGPEDSQLWKTPTVICLLIFGLLFLGTFIMWENSTKTPMVPPTMWENINVLLVNLLALTSAMAYYPSIFWVTRFLQEVKNLEPFDVAVRLLPQALMGFLFSPLVGLIMHRVSGTILLVVAALCLVCSNVLLVCLQTDSSYFSRIFPSLLLNTVGMDWTMNVGSLYILSTLPIEYHSTGASLLQTTMRLGLPMGLGVTTAVWSSFNRKMDDTMISYTKTFITTAAFAGFSLVVAPFVRIGRQGCTLHKINNSERQEKEEVVENCPSRRWSYIETISSKSTTAITKPELPPIRTTSFASELSMIEKTQNSSRNAVVSEAAQPKIIWVVCEQCNASQRVTEPIGDPTKYFEDIRLEKPNHDMIVNGGRRFPLTVKRQNINR